MPSAARHLRSSLPNRDLHEGAGEVGAPISAGIDWRSMLPVSLIVLSYLIGSIPFSYIVARLFAGEDIRQRGSRNVGATNVLRTVGKSAGAIALLLDGAKGYAVIALARGIASQPAWPFPAGPGNPLHSREMWVALAGLIAVLAHMFPLWLRFHGGKGVATATGAFLALDPLAVAAGAIVFAIVILSTRFVSLASMVSTASVPLFIRFLVNDAPFWRIIISILIALAVIMKHYPNVARLTQGTEQKLGERKE